MVGVKRKYGKEAQTRKREEEMQKRRRKVEERVTVILIWRT